MNVENMRNSQGKVWLNAGCGPRLIPEFVNLDTNWLVWFAPFYPVLKPLLKGGARSWIECYLDARKDRTARFKFRNCAKPLRVERGSVDHILASHFLEHLYRQNAI